MGTRLIKIPVIDVSPEDEKIIDDFEKLVNRPSKKRIKRYCLEFEEYRHTEAVKSMLGLYTCQRSSSGFKSCAELSGSPTLCALCYLCQCLGIKVPSPEDLLKYARENR